MVNLGLFSESGEESIDASSVSSSESSAVEKISCKKQKQHTKSKSAKSVSEMSDSDSDLKSSSTKNKSKETKTNRKKKHKKSLSKSSSSTSSSDSDSDSSSKSDKKKKKKKSKKSGMTKKSSDKVKIPQTWPHSVLQYEYVSENISFKNLDLKNFIAGELEILTSKLSKVEYKGRMKFLKKIVYYSSIYEWKRLLQFYAAWLRRIEMGLNSWGDDPTQIETAMLTGQPLKKSYDKGYMPKSEQTWWCSDYNRDKCSYKYPHQKTVKGHPRLVKHICATCWRTDNKQLQHPESSSACPYKI